MFGQHIKLSVVLGWARGPFLHVSPGLLTPTIPRSAGGGRRPAQAAIQHSEGSTSSRLLCPGLERGYVSPEILVSSFPESRSDRLPCRVVVGIEESIFQMPGAENESLAWLLTVLNIFPPVRPS